MRDCPTRIPCARPKPCWLTIPPARLRNLGAGAHVCAGQQRPCRKWDDNRRCLLYTSDAADDM
eukprot:716885-Alexandrium_andersonii.AAC.1